MVKDYSQYRTDRLLSEHRELESRKQKVSGQSTMMSAIAGVGVMNAASMYGHHKFVKDAGGLVRSPQSIGVVLAAVALGIGAAKLAELPFKGEKDQLEDRLTFVERELDRREAAAYAQEQGPPRM